MQNSSFKNSISYKTVIFTYLSFVILVLLGHIRDQFGKILIPKKYKRFFFENSIPPLYTSFESFYIRRLYERICDCWNRPITGVPGNLVLVKERTSNDFNKTFKFTGKNLNLLNFGSYNYLGFSINSGEIIEKDIETLKKYGIVDSFYQREFPENPIISELESTLANFLSTEAAIVYQMGYGTNICTLADIMSNSLILSDELNHMSLINGMKISNSKVVVYAHNNMEDLEEKLIYNLTQGQPSTHKSWDKIFVVCEGIFSMEGTVPDLKRIVELKRKYKFYIYLDEAHSIGAMGITGRGICEYLGVCPKSIDIKMGTFSKSFGGFGGYIAGSQKLINFLRFKGTFARAGEKMSFVVAKHILETIKSIIKDTSRITKLNENTRYMRNLLKSKKFFILGDENSPVIPILIFNPGKIAEFSRLCQDQGLGVVVVGFPATPILYSRVRICVSSSHTFDQIDKAVKIIDEIGTLIGMKRGQ